MISRKRAAKMVAKYIEYDYRAHVVTWVYPPQFEHDRSTNRVDLGIQNKISNTRSRTIKQVTLRRVK